MREREYKRERENEYERENECVCDSEIKRNTFRHPTSLPLP